MPTEQARRTSLSAILACAALLVPASALMAQVASTPPLFLIDAETRVDAVDFRFPSGTAVDPAALRQAIAYEGAGSLAGLRRALDFVPGISPPALERFDPLVLQQDVARMRQMYRTAGFPDVRLDYEVTLDEGANTVDVTFIVDQGAPVTLGSLEARPAAPLEDGDPSAEIQELPLPPELTSDWREYLTDQRGRSIGQRLSGQEISRLRNETLNWFQRRGYPWATVSVSTADTTDHAIDAVMGISPGPRARVDSIAIEGRQLLSEQAVRREIPIEVGDWFDATDLTIGETELYGLDLVRRALGDVVPGQPVDSTVSVLYRINESRPRLIWGRVGWRSESGLGGEAHWSHRDFLGGARTFTLSANLESGWGGLEEARGRTAGLSAIIQQPYVGHRSLSATMGPFIRYRDDFRDRSLLYGLESALILQRGPLKTLTLQHEISRLSVEEPFRLLTVRELVDLADDTAFAPIFVKSAFKLVGSYGELDDRLDPRSGFVVEPNVEVTGPSGISDVEYVRFGIKSMVAIPLSRRLGLFLHATGGRLFPLGESDPPLGGPERTRAIVGLRGVMFTAGGTATVRGWGLGLVGPKIPEIDGDPDGTIAADRWVPVGGLAQLTGSIEVGLPFPFLSEPHRSFVFLDAGRVWTPGGAFEPPDPELALEPWAYGAGAGLQFSTLFGPIRIAVGYKLNPTRVDLLSPAQVATALSRGEGLSGLSAATLHRWHLHFSIGRGL